MITHGSKISKLEAYLALNVTKVSSPTSTTISTAASTKTTAIARDMGDGGSINEISVNIKISFRGQTERRRRRNGPEDRFRLSKIN